MDIVRVRTLTCLVPQSLLMAPYLFYCRTPNRGAVFSIFGILIGDE
jgi:hypothetical protein